MNLKVCKLTDRVLELVNALKAEDMYFMGISGGGGAFRRIQLEEIYFFEAVKRYVYIGTRAERYETKKTLYQIEEMLADYMFVRISKSAIINIDKIETLVPEINGRFTVVLENGTKLSVSRAFVPALKDKLGVMG